MAVVDIEKRGASSVQDDSATDAPNSSDVFEALAVQEKDCDIKFRTMSWQRCALLLFGDQVCLAIMAQAWTLKVLGWVPGLLTSFISGILFWVTSYTMWQFIMKVRTPPFNPWIPYFGILILDFHL